MAKFFLSFGYVCVSSDIPSEIIDTNPAPHKQSESDVDSNQLSTPSDISVNVESSIDTGTSWSYEHKNSSDTIGIQSVETQRSTTMHKFNKSAMNSSSVYNYNSIGGLKSFTIIQVQYTEIEGQFYYIPQLLLSEAINQSYGDASSETLQYVYIGIALTLRNESGSKFEALTSKRSGPRNSSQSNSLMSLHHTSQLLTLRINAFNNGKLYHAAICSSERQYFKLYKQLGKVQQSELDASKGYSNTDLAFDAAVRQSTSTLADVLHKCNRQHKIQVAGQAGSFHIPQWERYEVCNGYDTLLEKWLLLLTENQTVLQVASKEYMYNLPSGNIFDPITQRCEYYTFGMYQHGLRSFLAGLEITNSHQHHGYSKAVYDMKLHCTTCNGINIEEATPSSKLSADGDRSISYLLDNVSGVPIVQEGAHPPPTPTSFPTKDKSTLPQVLLSSLDPSSSVGTESHSIPATLSPVNEHTSMFSPSKACDDRVQGTFTYKNQTELGSIGSSLSDDSGEVLTVNTGSGYYVTASEEHAIASTRNKQLRKHSYLPSYRLRFNGRPWSRYVLPHATFIPSVLSELSSVHESDGEDKIIKPRNKIKKLSPTLYQQKPMDNVSATTDDDVPYFLGSVSD